MLRGRMLILGAGLGLLLAGTGCSSTLKQVKGGYQLELPVGVLRGGERSPVLLCRYLLLPPWSALCVRLGLIPMCQLPEVQP